jgi:hypothetical protein
MLSAPRALLDLATVQEADMYRGAVTMRALSPGHWQALSSDVVSSEFHGPRFPPAAFETRWQTKRDAVAISTETLPALKGKVDVSL